MVESEKHGAELALVERRITGGSRIIAEQGEIIADFLRRSAAQPRRQLDVVRAIQAISTATANAC
jgi:hypothetical protein